MRDCTCVCMRACLLLFYCKAAFHVLVFSDHPILLIGPNQLLPTTNDQRSNASMCVNTAL